MMATRSLCDRDRVGAVIVDTQLRIVATGRNGPPAGFPHEEQTCSTWCRRAINGHPLSSDYRDCPSLHAEVNALLTSDRSRHEGGTIYITSDPCWSCGKMIANSGLSTVVVMSSSQKAAERNASATYTFMESFGVDVVFHEEKEKDDGGNEEAAARHYDLA
jgi:deoxycytidylate deaminase